MFKNFVQYLRLAKELTESTDINTIMNAANVMAANISMGLEPLEPTTVQKFRDFIIKVAPLLKTYGNDFIPHEYQLNLADTIDRNRITVVTHARQLGITTINMLYALFSATELNDQKVYVFSHSYSCAQDSIHKIYPIIDAFFPDAKIKKFEITFGNGSFIRPASYNQNKLRGERSYFTDNQADLIIVDNCGFIPNKVIPEIMSDIYRNPRTKFLFTSTATIPDTLIHRLMTDKYLEAARVYLSWNVHPDRDEKWAEMIKEQIGPRSYAQDYECMFVTDADKDAKPK